MFFSRRAGYKFVDRGDPAPYDFELGAFTTDAAWHDLTLPALVPINAKLLLLRVGIKSHIINKIMELSRGGNTNHTNVAVLRTKVNNIYEHGDLWVALNGTGKIGYMFQDVVWESIEVTIGGWFI